MTYFAQSPQAQPQLRRSHSIEGAQHDGYVPSDMQSQLELLRAIKQRNHQLRCLLEEMQPIDPSGQYPVRHMEQYAAQLSQPEDLPEDLKAIFLSYFPVGQAAS
ncbi:hypothetical protein ACHHYP_03239 [Achlya hypogyna]|uniref:Uncharacterized protein n=1 Tax=Achlya hypogyna TaxID=1202772 RepID=A0A1V9Z471_ACHHY|nr:hypothetical protein ACHHYP_03239 [Achlya hypogyna]